MRHRPYSGPIWPTHKRKARRQHSPETTQRTDAPEKSDLTTIARNLYRDGKIPASMLDYVATNRTRAGVDQSPPLTARSPSGQ